MESKVINKKMIEVIPEISDFFEQYSKSQDGIDTGSTIVLEDVFMVFYKEALSKNQGTIRDKCSKFIEWLSSQTEDEYAQNVLMVSIFEYIHFAADKSKLENLLGPQAKSLYLAIDWNI